MMHSTLEHNSIWGEGTVGSENNKNWNSQESKNLGLSQVWKLAQGQWELSEMSDMNIFEF